MRRIFDRPWPRAMLASVTAALISLLASSPAFAWADEGHRIIALIADRFLDLPVRQKIEAMLTADTDPLAEHDIAGAAVWADRFRFTDQESRTLRVDGGQAWHFMDLRRDAPDVDRACRGHPPLPAGMPASSGPAEACTIDKIAQFAAELSEAGTPAEERLLALKFVLHLVGDLHQPLHVAEQGDDRGNKRRITAPGYKGGTLHHFWDTEFVHQLGDDPREVAAVLSRNISVEDRAAWSAGSLSDWALETFRMADEDAYGKLPPADERGVYPLPEEYVGMAMKDVSAQLARAGLRLAAILNTSLQASPPAR